MKKTNFISKEKIDNQTEKRPRINMREKLHARMEKYSQLSAHNLPDDDYYRGRYDEDKELLQELEAKDERDNNK